MNTLLFFVLLFPVQEDIDSVIRRLGSEDPAKRGTAYGELVRLGPKAIPAAFRALDGAGEEGARDVERWVKQLRSRQWRKRDEAMRALAGMGTPARTLLEKLAESPEPEVAWRIRIALARIEEGAGAETAGRDHRRGALCEFLGESGDPRAVAVLLRVVGEKEEELTDTQLRAVEGLGRLRETMDEKTARDAATLVLGLVERVRMVRTRARLIRVLGGLRASLAVRPLVRFLDDRSERDTHLKRTCIAALAAVGDHAGIRAIVDALGSEEVYVREAASVFLKDLAKDDFGFDSRATPEQNGPAVKKYREWWSNRFGLPWTR